MYKIKILGAAQRDYEESLSWYDERNLSVAKNFVKAVESCLQIIASNPAIYNKVYKENYQYFMTSFPFTIFYSIDEANMLILVRAIYHQKRNPRNKYR